MTFNLLNSKKTTLKTIEKYVGNVTKGIQSSFTISITELDLTTVLTLTYVTYGVTGGTVSLI